MPSESADFYKDLVEMSQDLIWQIDVEGRYTYLNPAWEKVFGYKVEEMLGKRHVEFLSPETVAPEIQSLKTLLDSGANMRYEAIQLAKDGSPRHLTIHTKAIFDVNGKPVGARGTAHDNSERRQAEQELQATNGLLSEFIRHSPIYAFIKDVEPNQSRVVVASENFKEMVGISGQDMVGKTMEEMFPADLAASMTADDWAVASQGKIIQVDEELNGRFFTSYKFPIKQGKTTYLAGYTIDMTERKNSVQAMVEAERKFRALFEKGPIGVAFHRMVYDDAGKPVDYYFLDANESYQKLTGVDPRGQLVTQAFPGIELDPFDWIGTFGKVAMTGQEIRFEQYLVPNDRWYDVVGYQYKPDHFVAAFIEITDRKRAEMALKVAAERLILATQVAGVGIWDWDVVANRLVWDEQMYRLYGISAETFGGAYEAWTRGLHPEDVKQGDVEIQMALRGEKQFDTEFRVIWPDGSIRNLKAKSTVLRDPSGKPLRMIGTNWDITELKRQGDMLKTMLDTLPVGVFMVDVPNGKPLVANEVALQLLGRGILPNVNRENIGQVYQSYKEGFEGLYPLEEMPIIRGMRGESSHIDDMIVERPDGSSSLLEVFGSPVKDDRGSTWASLVTFMDITEKKIAGVRLRESEEKLSTLFMSMTELVSLQELVFDGHGNPVNARFLDCNDAFVRAIAKAKGLAKGDIVGKLATELYQVASPPHLSDYARVVAEGKAFEFSEYDELSDRHYFNSVVRLHHDQFATIATDITSIKQFQEVVVTKNKELENYLYVASHDLRSPLVNIQGFSQRMQQQVDDMKDLLAKCSLEPKVREELDDVMEVGIPKTVKFIVSGVAKMDALINGLLQISRTGRMELVVASVDMEALFKSILAAHSFQISEVSAEILLGPLPPCYGDENQLNQLFSNLVGNAIKYRDPRRALRLEINAHAEANRIRYSVKDNGIGIDKRHLDKIWDVFYRVDPASHNSGDGLGLSIIKRIADKHRGKVWAESEPGVGSVFHVELQRLPFSYNQELRF